MRRALFVLAMLLVPVAAPAQSPDSLLKVVDSLEARGSWREAMPVLEEYLRLRRDDAPRLRQLGQYQAWSGSRQAGIATLRQSLAAGPDDPGTLAALGEVLSWDPSSRDEAESLFARARSLDPANLKAREGQANLLTWRGQASRALPVFDSLLADHPAAVGVLRGKGGALNQLRRFDEARAVLGIGLELAPDDPGLRQELAQTSLGLGRYGDARSFMAGVTGQETHLRLLRDSTTRALGSYVEAEGFYRDRTEQLDALRGEGRLSLALGAAWRVSAGYRYSDFSDSSGHFSGSAWGAGLTFRPDGRFLLEARGQGEETEGPSETLWGGAARLEWQPSETIRLGLGATRERVEETRRSTQGVTDLDGFRGAVQASVGWVGLDLSLLRRRVELGGRVAYGANTGEGLERNDRFTGEFNAGFVVRTYRPYLRVGYAHQSAGFDYNASEYGALDFRQVGGYFSPYRYFLNYGTLTASHRFGTSLFWEFDGRVGGQVTREHQGDLTDTEVAGAVNTHLTWRAGRSTDFDVRYLYSNTFTAFRLHEVRVLLRQYF